MIQLDFGDRRPIYEQIRDKLKELIISGVLITDDKIPSVREMAAVLAINPNTIQKAYKDLENEGYIYSQKARGYFVARLENSGNKLKINSLFQELTAIIDEMKFLGVKREELDFQIEKIYKEEKQW